MAFIISIFCSMVFGLIALWAFKRKDPMHFWSGTTVKPEEISDIRAYNKANGIMWLVYSLGMLTSGVLSLFGEFAGGIFMATLCFPGLGVLIITYYRIYNKYKVQ